MHRTSLHPSRPIIVADSKIPFLKGRLEPFADITYLDPQEITADSVRDADGLIVRTRTVCDSRLLEGSRVKMIATATIGMDHLDLPWLSSHHIKAVNAPGCNAPGVAQYVWASLLTMGLRAERMRIGVVGYGNVGHIVADWGRKLGATVLVNDPPREEAGYSDERYGSLDTILRECDVVTLHTPLTKTGKHPTFHLISETELRKMRRGAVLVNAARGAVADNAVLNGLQDELGIFTVLDTWENEPSINLGLLEKATIATPHIAGYSKEGKQRATRMACEAIGEFFGFTPCTGDLAANYHPAPKVTAEAILRSYTPLPDTGALKGSPADFEKLRAGYATRPEPCF